VSPATGDTAHRSSRYAQGMRRLHSLLLLLSITACVNAPERVFHSKEANRPSYLARLGKAEGDEGGWASLCAEFESGNHGYSLSWIPETKELNPGGKGVCFFVGFGTADGRIGEARSRVTGGDLVLLRPGETLVLDAPLSGLVLTIPRPFPPDLPHWIHPNSDPRLSRSAMISANAAPASSPDTDYVLDLLAWNAERSPYLCHSVNAHRIRVSESAAYMHPLEGGHDQLYWIREASAGAELWIDSAEAAEQGLSSAAQAAGPVLEAHALQIHDLILVPRGRVHKLKGVSAIAISVPGTRPGSFVRVTEASVGTAAAEELDEASLGPKEQP
jgi:hypothetical protein